MTIPQPINNDGIIVKPLGTPIEPDPKPNMLTKPTKPANLNPEISPLMGERPALSAGGGWTYRPAALNAVDNRPIFTEEARRAWKGQNDRFYRPAPVSDRDPMCYAIVVDALMRMEHHHVLSSPLLAEFLNSEYPRFDWNPVMTGRIMANLAEAAIVPDLGKDTPIISKKRNNRLIFKVRTTARAWRWFTHMRQQLGEMADKSVALCRADPTAKYLWEGDFPYEMAEMA